MKDLPLEIQIRAFELAVDWVEKSKHALKRPTPTVIIEDLAQRFDIAYDSIVRTLIEVNKQA